MSFKIKISKDHLFLVPATILGFLIILYFFSLYNTLSLSGFQNESTQIESTVPYAGLSMLLSLSLLFIGIILSIIYAVKKLKT